MDDILRNLRERVLEEVSPSQIEIQNQQDCIERITNGLMSLADSLGYTYSFIEPQGSTGSKQTQLKSSSDIDLFVGLTPADHEDLFIKEPKTRRIQIEKLFDQMVDGWFVKATEHLEVESYQKAFSQHPYLSLQMQGFDVDIVGCFDITSEFLSQNGPLTAVDRTVHHSRFVSERITDSMREDIRILKSFIKACHAYGDKCAVGKSGFTGYTLELLILEVKDFRNALNRIETLEASPLDPLERTYDKLRAIEAFRDDHIIIIDPTDTKRNAASSVDVRSFQWIKNQLNLLLKAIDERKLEDAIEMVLEKQIPSKPIPTELGGYIRSYEFQMSRDIHYTIHRDKLQKLASKLNATLRHETTGDERFGQVFTEIILDADRIAMGVMLEHSRIERTFPHKGPPVSMVEAAERFRETHSEVYEREGFLWIERIREWTDAGLLIEDVLEQNPIKGLYRCESGVLARQVENILLRCVLQVEKTFRPEEWEQFKDLLPFTIQWSK